MMSKMTAVENNPSGKTISIGWMACPRALAWLSMTYLLSDGGVYRVDVSGGMSVAAEWCRPAGSGLRRRAAMIVAIAPRRGFRSWHGSGAETMPVPVDPYGSFAGNRMSGVYVTPAA